MNARPTDSLVLMPSSETKRAGWSNLEKPRPSGRGDVTREIGRWL